MDIIMEIHKIVLASISFNNLSKESFLSFTFNKCLYFSLKWTAGKCQIKSDNILVLSCQPASQVITVFEDVGRRPDQPDQDVYSSLPAKWVIFLVGWKDNYCQLRVMRDAGLLEKLTKQLFIFPIMATNQCTLTWQFLLFWQRGEQRVRTDCLFLGKTDHLKDGGAESCWCNTVRGTGGQEVSCLFWYDSSSETEDMGQFWPPTTNLVWRQATLLPLSSGIRR